MSVKEETFTPEVKNWSVVYVIYSADTVADSPAFIESMAPAKRHNASEFADAFVQTEGDEEYGFGYLADGPGRDEFRPYADRENEDDVGNGMHRKWVGELTREQWRAFAEGYCIDLDEDDLPTDFMDTMGSITEYGHIPAVAVDNTEGWGCSYWGYEAVIDSQFYLSFGGEQ